MRRADRRLDTAHSVFQRTKGHAVLPEVILPDELTRDRLDRRCSIRPLPHCARTGISADLIAAIDAALGIDTPCSIHDTAAGPLPAPSRASRSAIFWRDAFRRPAAYG